MKKSEIREMIQEEITTWDKDFKSATQIRSELEKAYVEIDNKLKLIEKKLSGANSPGLRLAFEQGLKQGLRRSGKMFDVQAAKERLSIWYER